MVMPLAWTCMAYLPDCKRCRIIAERRPTPKRSLPAQPRETSMRTRHILRCAALLAATAWSTPSLAHIGEEPQAGLFFIAAAPLPPNPEEAAPLAPDEDDEEAALPEE